jgi:hypothetical protein
MKRESINASLRTTSGGCIAFGLEKFTCGRASRQVNMAKGDFMFAAANQIPKLMHEFGRGPLREYIPCRFEGEDELATALAVIHAEFILIHPFREGEWALRSIARDPDGTASGLTGARLWRDTRREEA